MLIQISVKFHWKQMDNVYVKLFVKLREGTCFFVAILSCLFICRLLTSRELSFERSRQRENCFALRQEETEKGRKKMRRWGESDVRVPELNSFSIFFLASPRLTLSVLFSAPRHTPNLPLFPLPHFLWSLALCLSLSRHLLLWCCVTGFQKEQRHWPGARSTFTHLLAWTKWACNNFFFNPSA